MSISFRAFFFLVGWRKPPRWCATSSASRSPFCWTSRVKVCTPRIFHRMLTSIVADFDDIFSSYVMEFYWEFLPNLQKILGFPFPASSRGESSILKDVRFCLFNVLTTVSSTLGNMARLPNPHAAHGGRRRWRARTAERHQGGPAVLRKGLFPNQPFFRCFLLLVLRRVKKKGSRMKQKYEGKFAHDS